MEKKRRKPLISILFILAMIMLMGSVAFSWFTNSKNVAVNLSDGDADLAVTAVNSLEVRLVSSSLSDGPEKVYDLLGAQTLDPWGSKIVLGAPSASFLDITGDGKNLWLPRFLDGNDQVPSASALMDVSDDDNQYISLRLGFRSSVPMDVYLDADSFVSPAEVVDQAPFNRKSLFGNFSCDAIAGAARVAFLQPQYYEADDGSLTETEPRLISVWVPNDTIQLTNKSGRYTLKTAGASEKAAGKGYGYLTVENGELKHVYYSEEDYTEGRVMVGTDGLAVYDENTGESVTSTSSVPVASIDPAVNGGEAEVIVRIWFEGTDREADMALNGGSVHYGFEFAGKLREASEEE